jgi:[ribosomal protein S5]-alanine N-acetyltransferase
MLLQGQLCMLRAWRMSDAASIVRHANNINVARQLRDRFPHPYTSRDAHAFLRFALGASPQTNFAIEVGGQAAGGLGYVAGADMERYSAEVGYWIGEECWGRGIVSEALILFTNYAFSSLRLLRLYALPFADNLGSIRVLEKAGYSLEGLLRSSCVKYGEVRDQVLYAKVNEDWAARD